MSYVLEKVTPEDQQRILSDANDSQKRKILTSQFFANSPDLTWAVDRDRGCYLVFAPRLTREDGEISPFYFHLGTQLIEFYVPTNLGNAVTFVSLPAMTPDEYHNLKVEIAAAFLTYGRFGRGLNNGDWLHALVPSFEQE